MATSRTLRRNGKQAPISKSLEQSNENIVFGPRPLGCLRRLFVFCLRFFVLLVLVSWLFCSVWGLALVLAFLCLGSLCWCVGGLSRSLLFWRWGVLVVLGCSGGRVLRFSFVLFVFCFGCVCVFFVFVLLTLFGLLCWCLPYCLGVLVLICYIRRLMCMYMFKCIIVSLAMVR